MDIIFNQRKIAIYLLTVIWMIVIFYLSSQVADTSNAVSLSVSEKVASAVNYVVPKAHLTSAEINHYVRKNAHFFAYMILGVLLILASERKLISLIIGGGYAISDEVHQIFVPGRGPGVMDVLIDISGLILGIILFSLLKHVLMKIKHMD